MVIFVVAFSFCINIVEDDTEKVGLGQTELLNDLFYHFPVYHTCLDQEQNPICVWRQNECITCRKNGRRIDDNDIKPLLQVGYQKRCPVSIQNLGGGGGSLPLGSRKRLVETVSIIAAFISF